VKAIGAPGVKPRPEKINRTMKAASRINKSYRAHMAEDKIRPAGPPKPRPTSHRMRPPRPFQARTHPTQSLGAGRVKPIHQHPSASVRRHVARKTMGIHMRHQEFLSEHRFHGPDTRYI
jgi:hypothetical protein